MTKRSLLIGLWHDYDTLEPQLLDHLERHPTHMPTDIYIVASATGAKNLRRSNVLLWDRTQTRATLRQHNNVHVHVLTIQKNATEALDSLDNQKYHKRIKTQLIQIAQAVINHTPETCDLIFNEDAPSVIRVTLLGYLTIHVQAHQLTFALYWAAAPSGGATWDYANQHPISQPSYQSSVNHLATYSPDQVDPQSPALLKVGKTILIENVPLAQPLDKQPQVTYGWIACRKASRARITFVYGDSRKTPGVASVQWTGIVAPSFQLTQNARIANPEEKVWFFWQVIQYVVFNQFITRGSSNFKLFDDVSNHEMLRVVDDIARTHYGETNLAVLYGYVEDYFKATNQMPWQDLAKNFGLKLSTDISRANADIRQALKGRATQVPADYYEAESICSKDSGVRRYDVKLSADQIAISPQLAKLIGGDQSPRTHEIPPRPLQRAIARV